MSTPRPPVWVKISSAKPPVREFKDVPHPHRTKEPALPFRSGGCKYFGAGALRELDRGHADSSRGRMNKNTLTRTHARNARETIFRRKKSDRESSSLFRAHPFRATLNHVGLRDRKRGEAGSCDGQHRVADANMCYAGADPGDPPGAFSAQSIIEAGPHSEDIKHVIEVQSGCFDGDLDLVRRYGTPFRRLTRKLLERARRRGD